MQYFTIGIFNKAVSAECVPERQLGIQKELWPTASCIQYIFMTLGTWVSDSVYDLCCVAVTSETEMTCADRMDGVKVEAYSAKFINNCSQTHVMYIL